MGKRHNIKRVEKEIIELIKEKPIFSFSDIFVYYPKMSRATAYNYGLDKLDSIKEALYGNRRKGVASLMSKWIQSQNPTLQIAAMRMIADEDERRKLNQQYIENNIKAEQPIRLDITLPDEDDEGGEEDRTDDNE